MTLLGVRVAVSIPDSLLEDKHSLRDKTEKLGTIARACSIYGVDVVEVYKGGRGGGESALITKVLGYLETPQYLRKALFPIDEDLRFAGALPPLKIPSHKAKVLFEDVSVGEVREGIARRDGTVDVGLDRTPRLRSKASGGRVTVRITSKAPFEAEAIGRDAVDEYWGYNVEAKSLGEVIDDPRFRMKVGTSRLGQPFRDAVRGLRGMVNGMSGVKLVFGSPSRGIFDLFDTESTKKLDAVVNLFPEQKVETVRTEEAIFVGLGFLGFLISQKA